MSVAQHGGSDPRIVTPEAVVLDLESAGVGSRGVALLIDWLVLATVSVLLFLAELSFGFGGFVDGWLALAVLLVLGFAAQFGYPIGFETLWRGRTPGKAALGLRVVTVEGAPVGLRHATIRATVGLVELTATFGFLAAVTSVVSPRGQRLGDLAAGTIVVRERRARSGAIEVERFVPPPGLEAYTAALDVSALGPADYATVREVLRRAHGLAPSARAEVAGRVASALVARVSPPPPEGVDPMRWLGCVAAAVQARSTPVVPGPSAPSAPSAPPPGPMGTSWGAARPTPRHAEEVSPPSGGGFAPPG